MTTARLTDSLVDRVAVELCAGLGGIGLGLRSLGFHVVRAYDSWDEAVAVYNRNFPGEVAAICNLLSEKGRRLVKDDRLRIGDVDVLAADPRARDSANSGTGAMTAATGTIASWRRCPTLSHS